MLTMITTSAFREPSRGDPIVPSPICVDSDGSWH
jgi:hypothetical protein